MGKWTGRREIGVFILLISLASSPRSGVDVAGRRPHAGRPRGAPPLIGGISSVASLPMGFSPRALAGADQAQGTIDYRLARQDRKSTRLNSSHVKISYAVFCLKK